MIQEVRRDYNGLFMLGVLFHVLYETLFIISDFASYTKVSEYVEFESE